MRRMVPAHRRLDLAFAVALAAALQAAVWSSSAFEGRRGENAAAALLLGTALFLRLRRPVVPIGAGLILIAVPAFHELANSAVVAVAMIASLYSAGVSSDRAQSLGGAMLGSLSIVLSALTSDPFSPNDTLWVALIASVSWSAGYLTRRTRRRTLLLEHRNLRLEAEQDAAAARATAQERMRIARELHDVVAHALSLIVVQARGGRRMVNRGAAAEALDAFETVEHAAQEGLDEMRRLLGMLRADGAEPALAPMPGLAHLSELISQVAEAGLEAELIIEHEPRALPPGIDVSAYRIIQEALTNALRHSGAAWARVVVTYGPDSLDVEVFDEGRGNQGAARSGHGLIGIRERVAIYGGEFRAGTRPEGGYVVRVHLPLTAAP